MPKRKGGRKISELRTVATKRRNEEKSLSTENGKIKESNVKARKTVYRPKTEKRRVEGKKEWEKTKNDEQI